MGNAGSGRGGGRPESSPDPPRGAGRTGRRAALAAVLAALVALAPATPAAARQQPAESPPSTAEPATARSAATPDSAMSRQDAAASAVAPRSPEAPPPAPGLLRSGDLLYGGLFFGLLAMVEPLEAMDHGLSDGLAVGGGEGPFLTAATLAGNLWVDLGLAAGAFAGGELLGHESLATAGLRSLETLLLADAIATVFKFGLGRQRPLDDGEPDVFRPGHWDHEYFSFPSGHTAHVFALAATLDRETEAPWVPWIAYPGAGAVAASRVLKRKHWPTDIVAGAAVGLFAAELVGRLHVSGDAGDRPHRSPPRLSVGPGARGGLQVGIAVSTR